jgi:hypothetical protein
MQSSVAKKGIVHQALEDWQKQPQKRSRRCRRCKTTPLDTFYRSEQEHASTHSSRLFFSRSIRESTIRLIYILCTTNILWRKERFVWRTEKNAEIHLQGI